MTSLSVHYQSGTLGMAPDCFGSCLGYFSEHTKNAVTVLAKLLYFKATWHLWHYATLPEHCVGHPFYTKSAVSTEGAVARACI